MKNSKLISGIYTAVLMALVVVVLLAFGYDPPDPPIPEEGVEVNLGNSDFGKGNSPEPPAEASSYAPPAAENQVMTQRTEQTVAINSSPKPTGTVTNPAATEQSKMENKEPVINQNAIFTGKRNRNTSDGGSEGITSGTGNQGNPDGTPDSKNYYGNGSDGNSYSLTGRTAVSLPKPTYNSNMQGKVVVTIWVDQQGRVTRAEYQPKGSNTANDYLVRQAIAAAKKAHFNASKDADEEQKGTITYIFKI